MNWKKIALGSTLAGTLLLSGFSGQALAYWGCDAPGRNAASPADQAKIDEIRQKYDAELTSLEANLRLISRDLDQALVDKDSANVAELRQKLYESEGEYYTVRDQAWAEMNRAGATGNWERSGWNCRWHDGNDGARAGGTAMTRWAGNRGGCCW
jgi:Skp family chaperone for outer membrane proteins